MQFTFYLTVTAILLTYSQNSHCEEFVSQVISNLQHVGSFVDQVIDNMRNVHDTFLGPIDCQHLQKKGINKSGIYRIWPISWQIVGSFLVLCDMKTDGGGWTVIQKRGNYRKPIDYFYRGWEDYSVGFGKLSEDFWLGNEKIYALTNQGSYSLRIEMKDKERNWRFAFYRNFWIENEKCGYKLHVSGYSGNAGDSFSNMNGMKFTTKDRDNDIGQRSNCAQTYKGGWWYTSCHISNLNGLYLDGYHSTFADGIEWRTWKGLNYSLPEVRMKIRRIN